MIKALQYFIVIAEKQSLSAAAAQLGVTQPALSQSMHALSRSFEAELFEKAGRRLILTAAGEHLLKGAVEITGSYQKLINEVRRIALEDTGRSLLRVGYLKSTGTDLLRQAVTVWSAEFPGARVSLKAGSHSALSTQLQNGSLDVLLTEEAHGITEGCVMERLGELQSLVMFSARLPQNAQITVNLESFGDLPLIVPADETAFAEECRSISAAGGFSGTFVRAGDLQEAGIMAAAAQGFVLLQRSGSGRDPALAVKPAFLNGHRLTCRYCALRQGSTPSASLSRFIGCLRAALTS